METPVDLMDPCGTSMTNLCLFLWRPETATKVGFLSHSADKSAGQIHGGLLREKEREVWWT